MRTGELKVAKVAGENNPADLLTKHVNAATLQKHTWELGFEVLQDRAATAPSSAAAGAGRRASPANATTRVGETPGAAPFSRRRVPPRAAPVRRQRVSWAGE